MSGKSRGGKELDRSPVNQPNRPPKEDDDGFVATAVELENLANPLL